MVKTKIAVGIPTVAWRCTIGIADLMQVLGYMSERGDVPYAFENILQSANSSFSWPADYQRNLIVKRFLASDNEWLWFIDSDILPAENWMELLPLLKDADVVAGIYPLMSLPPDPPVVWTCYDWHGENFKIRDITRAGEVVRGRVGAATGFMFIHRKVLEDPAVAMYPGCDPPAIFKLRFEDNGKPMGTEDLLFCRKVLEAGHRISVHTGVRSGHVKTEDIRTVQSAMDSAMNYGFKIGTGEVH